MPNVKMRAIYLFIGFGIAFAVNSSDETLPTTATPYSTEFPVMDASSPFVTNSTSTDTEISTSSSFVLGKGKNSSTLPGENCSLVSDPCNFNYNVVMNSSSVCTFKCAYDPSKLQPLKLEVHLTYRHPTLHPTFVSAQQQFYLNSWTLPALFPNRGEIQKYTSLDELLCPPRDERNETVVVRITTDSPDNITMNVRLANISYDLQMGNSVVLKSTPVSPDYRLYQWTGDQTSVLISADSVNSSNSVCAILALQNAKCPIVTDKSSLRSGGGRYQTFTTRAGMVARRSDYPDGIHMIFWPLPDDDSCTLAAESPTNRTSRQKSIKFQVFNHMTIGSTWYIFLITGILIILVMFGLTLISLKVIERNLNSAASTHFVDDDERELLEEEDSRQRGVFGEGGVAVLTGSDNGPIPSLGGRYSQALPQGTRLEGLANQSTNSSLVPSGGYNPPFSPPTTYAPHPAAMNFTASFNPVYVFWWKRYAFFESETAEAQVSEMGFQHNILIMAVFAALPTTELIRSYWKMLSYHGDEDQCFFNSYCLSGFWIFHDFSRVFTNIGYIVAGFLFSRIVAKHKQLTHKILSNYNSDNTVGVSRHYGLFVSLGYGLIIQGVMSSLYHTCPNSVTIRFDMMFMYVMVIAAIISIWGLRHGDVTHHVYPTMGLIGTTLLLAEGREWFSSLTFWLLMSLVYLFLLMTTTVLMSSYGIWSFSPLKMLQVWKGWKPVRNKLAAILRDEDRTPTPLHVMRIGLGVIVNVALILCGAIADPNVYSYILVVCLVNLGLYFINYLITKRLCFKEKGTSLAWVYLLLSFVFWILALAAFCYRNTDSEASASDSRGLNSPCAFFGVFDTHDAWHIMSSLALFTFFIGLLTLDDDLSNVPSKRIHVF